jgi:hypothetical protein
MNHQTETRRVTESSRRFTAVRGIDADGVDSVSIDLYATIDGTEYRVSGYGVKANHMALAQRLGNARVAKAIGRNLMLVRRDVAIVRANNVPEWYAWYEGFMPMGRTLRADLNKVGF